MSTPDPDQPLAESSPADPPDSYGSPDLSDIATTGQSQPFPGAEPDAEAPFGTYELDPAAPYEPHTSASDDAPTQVFRGGAGRGDAPTQQFQASTQQFPATPPPSTPPTQTLPAANPAPPQDSAPPAPGGPAPTPAEPPAPPAAQPPEAHAPQTQAQQAQPQYAPPQYAQPGQPGQQASDAHGAPTAGAYAQPQYAAAGAYGTQPGYGTQNPPYQGAPYGAPSAGQYAPPQGTYGGPGYAAPGYAPVDPYAKSRVVAGILGILLGWAGVHRFYLGYTGIGIAQIIVTFVTAGVGGLWGFVEGILYLTQRTGTYSIDATGRPLRD